MVRGYGFRTERRKERVVPHQVWNLRREETYFHTEQGLLRRRPAVDRAAEAGLMGSHRESGGLTRHQLYEEAKELNIRGRSMMNKHELRSAVDHKAGR